MCYMKYFFMIFHFIAKQDLQRQLYKYFYNKKDFIENTVNSIYLSGHEIWSLQYRACFSVNELSKADVDTFFSSIFIQNTSQSRHRMFTKFYNRVVLVLNDLQHDRHNLTLWFL